MRLYYTRQRKKLIDYMGKSRLKNLCTIIENDSGLHFLVKLHTKLSDEDVKARLNAKDIQIRALSEYFLTPNTNKAHYFIVNYSNIDTTRIPEICERIYESLVG